MQGGMLIKSKSCVGAYSSHQSTVGRFGATGDFGQRDFVSNLYKDTIHQTGEITRPEILAGGPSVLAGSIQTL